MFIVFVLGLSLKWLQCKCSLLSQKASGGSLPSQPGALKQTTSLVEFDNLPRPALGLAESPRCLRVFRMTGSLSVDAKWPFHQDSWKESSRSIQRVAKARGCQHLDIRRALVWRMNLWVELGFRGVHEHRVMERSNWRSAFPVTVLIYCLLPLVQLYTSSLTWAIIIPA